MDRKIGKQLDRLESLAYRVRVNRFILEYLGEWADDKADLYRDDRPNMTDGEKIQNRDFLKENFKRYREILAQSSVDMTRFETEMMDIREQITRAADSSHLNPGGDRK